MTEIETSETAPQKGRAVVVGVGLVAGLGVGVGFVVGATVGSRVVIFGDELVVVMDVDVGPGNDVMPMTSSERVVVDVESDCLFGLVGQTMAAMATMVATPLMSHGV